MFASSEGHTAAVQALLADARVDVNMQNKVSNFTAYLTGRVGSV